MDSRDTPRSAAAAAAAAPPPPPPPGRTSHHQQPSSSSSTTLEVTRKLMARLGLENDAKIMAATTGSARKKRYLEKIMVAELHYMQGELTEEKATLQNENAALKQAIQELKARQEASG